MVRNQIYETIIIIPNSKNDLKLNLYNKILVLECRNKLVKILKIVDFYHVKILDLRGDVICTWMEVIKVIVQTQCRGSQVRFDI